MLSACGVAAIITSGSHIDRWFETNMTGSFTGKFSRPNTWILIIDLVAQVANLKNFSLIQQCSRSELCIFFCPASTGKKLP